MKNVDGVMLWLSNMNNSARLVAEHYITELIDIIITFLRQQREGETGTA